MKTKATIFYALFFSGIISSLFAQRYEAPVSADPIWSQELRGTVIGLPTLQAESAVVVLEEGEVKSYSRFGNWLWTYDAKERLTPYVSRSREGTSYICTVGGTVIAVNRIGRELWRIDLDRAITSPVVVGWDGRLFIPAGSRLHCRTASGYSLWGFELTSPFAVKPILDRRGGIAFVQENNQFTLVGHLSTVERFQLDSRPLHIVPLLSSAGKDSFFLFFANGQVQRLYRGDDEKLVSENLPSLSQAPAAAVGYKDKVAVTLRDGRVQLLSVPEGQVLWTENSHETTAERGSGNVQAYAAHMQFDERGIYVLSARGATGFRESDGASLWILRITTGAVEIPSFSDEGYLYSGGTDRILYAYRVEERRRNIPRSLYGSAPEGSYGLGNPPPSSWANAGTARYDPNILKIMYDEIENGIKTGQIGPNETDYVAYIMEVAGISFSPSYSPVRPEVQIQARADAIRQLGYLGSRETIPFLAKLFSHKFPNGTYEDPEIQRACAEAIGRIGVDPAGDAIRAFTYLLGPANVYLDPGAINAAASATRDLCRFSGPPLADAGVRLLRAFATYPAFPNAVRAHAKIQLDNLYK